MKQLILKTNSSKDNTPERKGNKMGRSTNTEAIKHLKQKRQLKPEINALFDLIIQGNRTALGRGITLIESQNPADRDLANELITKCLNHSKSESTIRVGITGVPGVGKSTFIESLGKHLLTNGKKIAILAVDPSSTITKGSILGDKTRMVSLVQEHNVFIRPSASGTILGGVGQYTREAIILCEAAGFSNILIETVGIGQSEIEVSEMVDFVLLLKLAGAGDELQGIKRGVIEMADSILINKADGDNMKAAKKAKIEFKNALHFCAQKTSGWVPKVQLCSATEEVGIAESWQLVKDYIALTKSNGYFDRKRENQNVSLMKKNIENQLKSSFFNHPLVESNWDDLKHQVKHGEISSFQAAQHLLELYKSSL